MEQLQVGSMFIARDCADTIVNMKMQYADEMGEIAYFYRFMFVHCTRACALYVYVLPCALFCQTEGVQQRVTNTERLLLLLHGTWREPKTRPVDERGAYRLYLANQELRRMVGGAM